MLSTMKKGGFQVQDETGGRMDGIDGSAGQL